MMNAEKMSLEEIRRAGLKALARELGPVGMIRFLQQYETGYGDYSVERHEWLDQLDIDTIFQGILQQREAGKATANQEFSTVDDADGSR